MDVVTQLDDSILRKSSSACRFVVDKVSCAAAAGSLTAAETIGGGSNSAPKLQGLDDGSLILVANGHCESNTEAASSATTNNTSSSINGQIHSAEAAELLSAKPAPVLLNGTGAPLTPLMRSNRSATNRSVSFHVGNGGQEEEESYEDNLNTQQRLDDRHQQTGISECSSSNMTYGNVKSFRNMETVEKLPNIDHYRNLMSVAGAMTSRPTLSELHGEDKEANADLEIGEIQLADDSQCLPKSVAQPAGDCETSAKASGPKFGWIQGVLIRCVLNIIGVMLYLRLSWVTGQAGIGLGSLIVLVSSTVTVITAISMCAISTNGEIKGGGAYFMISRSLGPNFGASIGLIFAFANAVAAAMYAVGFAETVRDVMKDHGTQLIDGSTNDIRVIAIIATCCLLGVTVVGVAFESKAQMVLMVILAASVLDYFIGTVLPTTPEKEAKGLTGYSSTTFQDNLLPAWRNGENFFSVFAVFFPAATGILAGANISGDLADPQKAIPKGTLLAILLTTVLYLMCIWTTGATVVRDASGDMIEFFAGNFTDCAANATCKFGLMNHFQIMEMGSAWGPLISAGIFAATLSSALASLVSAPKVFQAVCQDKLFPFIHVFARGYGGGNEPRRAYVLAFGIAIAVILIGDLNAIAPIISNFFLAAYALVNYATFDASLAKSPGFRPSFRYYSMWLSLAGALLCVAVMFIISWWTALLTFAFIALLYLYVRHRRPEVNWGSSSQAHSYKNALLAMHRLQATEEHIKNYRPQLLVLTGNPVARPSLVDFASSISKDTSLMVCGHIVFRKSAEPVPNEYLLLALAKFRFQIIEWFRKRKIKSFYNPVAAVGFREGVQSLLQLSGLGKLRINVVLLGFKNNWRSCTGEQINEYFNVIHDCFDANMGVGILRVPNGLDFSELIRQYNLEDTTNLRIPESVAAMTRHASCLNVQDDTIVRSDFSRPSLVQSAGVKSQISQVQDTITSTHSTAFTATIRSTNVDIVKNNFKLNNCVPRPEELEKLLSSTSTQSASTTPRRSRTPELRSATSIQSASPLSDKGIQIRITSSESLAAIQAAETAGVHRTKMELEQCIFQFSLKVKKPVVHVWWLFDDGGLTLLVAHLLCIQRSYLEGASLRVFTIASSRRQLEQEQRTMAALLSKFRIEFSDVTVIPDITKKPAAATVAEFEEIIADFKCPGNGETMNEFAITDAELVAQRDKTNRQLRTRELLLEHSATDATLIVLTLPIPRKGACSAALYMTWLELLTRDLPPILLLRGNQQSVLTFYS